MKRLLIILAFVMFMFPLVSAGDTVLTYDPLGDSIFNTTLWSNATTSSGTGSGTITETAPIIFAATSGGGTATGTILLETKAMMNTSELSEYLGTMIWRIDSDGSAGSGSANTHIINKVFGTTFYTANVVFGSFNQDSIWSVNYSNTVPSEPFDIYDDGVKIQTTDTDSNNISLYCSISVTSGPSTTCYDRIYEINYTLRRSVIPLQTTPVDLFSTDNDTVEFNATFRTPVTGLVNFTLINSTLYVWNNSGFLINTTTNVISGVSNQTSVSVSGLTIGRYTWNYLACTNYDCAFGDSNLSFDYAFLVNSETFNTVVNDLTNQTFTLNLTFSPSILTNTASFVYNDVSYSAVKTEVGPDTIYSRVLDIPAVSSTQNNTFYWNILSTNGGSQIFNTTAHNQTVNPTIFAQCNATYTTASVNFTIAKESDPSINLIADFDATFTWNLGGVQSKNVSVNLTSSDSYQFCIQPNGTYFTDVELQISATGYQTRNYFLTEQQYTNITQFITLYLLNSSAASNIIIEVKDEGLAPLPDYTVKIYRFLPSTGSFILVAQRLTDTFGQFSESLVENTARYKFEFYDTDNVLIRTTERTNIICRSTICVLSFVVEPDSTVFNRFDDILNHEFTFLYDNATEKFVFTFNDNTGTSPTHRLLVQRFGFNGTVDVCDLSSSALVGTIECATSSIKGNYFGQVYRTVGGVETRIGTLDIVVGDTSATFGKEGLLWVALLLFVVVAVGLFSPVVSIVLFLVTHLALGVSGIVYMSPAIFMAELVIGGLVIWAFRS